VSVVVEQAGRLIRRIGGVLHPGNQSVGAVFARGSMFSVGVNVAGAATSFAVQIVLAQALGEAGYGTYAVVLGWMNWGALLARVQLDGCAARFVAAYAATGEAALLRGFIATSHRVVAGVAGLMALTAALILLGLRHRLDPVLFRAGLAGAALLVPASVILLTGACLQGFQRMVAAQLAPLVLRPAVLGLLTAGATFLLHVTIGPATAILFNLAGSLLALAMTWSTLRRATLEVAGPGPRQYAAVEWRRTAIGLTGVAIAQQVLSPQTDVLIVGALITTELAGVYNAASQVAALITFGVQAVSVMGAPMIAQLYAERRFADLQRLTTHYGRINLAVALPVLVILGLIGSFSLGLFGEAFRAGYPVLMVLAAGQVVQAVVGVQGGYLLTMTGHERLAGRIAGLAAALNLAASLLLTARFGMVGTASATVLAGLVRSVLLGRAIRRQLGIRLLPWP
jgi:O-antigen/teichoic acid export membrane protein